MTKLNLGCGPHALDGWFNYDLVATHRVSAHDLSNGIPTHIQPDSVDFIHSEHFIEHITRDQCERLLRDCFRVLRCGGAIRLSTPDLRYLCSQYVSREKIGIPGTWDPHTGCQGLNEGMRSWGHQFLYDDSELSDLLGSVGFRDVTIEKWRDSSFPELRGLEVRPYHHDLIVEAVKPRSP